MTDQESVYQVWLPVIGRALSHLCLHMAEMDEKTLAEKAMFLEGLGLDRKDAAAMLGTSYASITESLSQAKRRKKGARKSAAKSKRKKAR